MKSGTRRKNKIEHKDIISSGELEPYLSQPMEIQPYAWQIFHDLQIQDLNKEKMIDLLKSSKNLEKFSSIYAIYSHTFDYKSSVIKRLIKEIFKYIDLHFSKNKL